MTQVVVVNRDIILMLINRNYGLSIYVPIGQAPPDLDLAQILKCRCMFGTHFDVSQLI